MNPQFSWRAVLNLILSDRELYGTFFIGIVLLGGELAAPESWKLALRSVALAMLVIGIIASVRNKIRVAKFLQEDKHIPVVMMVGAARRMALQGFALAKDRMGPVSDTIGMIYSPEEPGNGFWSSSFNSSGVRSMAGTRYTPIRSNSSWRVMPRISAALPCDM